MIESFDFFCALHDLLKQIPEGMQTTIRDIAKAMGEEKASGAIAESLKRVEFEYAKGNIVRKAGRRAFIFKDFETDRPLLRLADLQRSLSVRVVQTDCFESAELVAGVDVSYSDDYAYGACAILDRDMHQVDLYEVKMKVSFPYISGYLAFREGPVIEALVGGVSNFDILLINGHGVAHPRGCGLACHVGVDLDRPTIGVASKLIIGCVESPANGWSLVKYRGKIMGAILRRKGGSSVYVSVGHKVSMETAVDIVQRMQVSGGTPEPIRVAHAKALESKRADEPST